MKKTWVPGFFCKRTREPGMWFVFLGTGNPYVFRVPRNGNPYVFRVPGNGNPYVFRVLGIGNSYVVRVPRNPEHIAVCHKRGVKEYLNIPAYSKMHKNAL